MGGGEVLKKGQLIKSPPLDGGALKMWRKRWFVLLSSKVLEYYKSEGGELRGVINLEDCHSVNSNLSHKRYKHVFNIETKERVFFLVAKTQLEMEAWVEALCKVCGLHSDNTSLLANTPPACPPPTSSSKSKGPNISQPIYATSNSPNGIPFTEQFKTMPPAIPIESVYSLQANADYQVRQEMRRGSADVPAGVPLSEALSSKGLGSNRASAVSGGSGGDMGGNRLSATALFTPRPGDSQGYLGVALDGQSVNSLSPVHKPAVKARSATSTAESLSETSGLEHRSHTNAVAYSTTLRQPLGGAEVLSNGYMKPSSIDRSATLHVSPRDTSNHYSHLQDSSPSGVSSDHESLVQNSIYDVPPPIDRSNKPLQAPPAVDRTLKPGRRKGTDSSDSSEEGSPEHQLSTPPPPSTTKLPASSSSSTDETIKEDSESTFNPSDIPQVTVRSTHYTQVDFNPDTRRPVPLPRKTSNCSGGGTPTSLVPRARRVNYSDVDIKATNQLAENLNRQMTVREAERKALAEKQYINIDRSGTIDDETDPDYYTHMRDFNLEEADKPEYFTVKMYQHQKQQALEKEDNPQTIEQDTHENTM